MRFCQPRFKEPAITQLTRSGFQHFDLAQPGRAGQSGFNRRARALGNARDSGAIQLMRPSEALASSTPTIW